MIELMEHPFFTRLIGPTGNDHHVNEFSFFPFICICQCLFCLIFYFVLLKKLSCELKHLISQVNSINPVPHERIALVKNCIKKYAAEPEKMIVEDLSALDKLTDDRIIEEIKQRLIKGESYSFIGDVLVSVNSNELPNQYPRSVRFFSYIFNTFTLKYTHFLFIVS